MSMLFVGYQHRRGQRYRIRSCQCQSLRQSHFRGRTDDIQPGGRVLKLLELAPVDSVIVGGLVGTCGSREGEQSGGGDGQHLDLAAENSG